MSEWFTRFRFQLAMIGVLAALGLVLASLGLYALTAYQVATRRKELGIRKAMGARDGTLMWSAFARGVTMALLGALIGLGGWYQLLPMTRDLVDGIDAAGYMVPVVVALVVGGSCVFATLIPAVRAAQVDPMMALKVE